MHAHVVDALPRVGGQCSELYPDKPIYDIPALPVCSAQELIDRLMQQIRPFHTQFHLGQLVTALHREPNGRFLLETSAGTVFDTATPTLISTWSGLWTTNINATIDEIFDVIEAGGTISQSYSATKITVAPGVIPEPATLLTFGVGALVAARARRKAKKA